jgi:DNA polymerase I
VADKPGYLFPDFDADDSAGDRDSTESPSYVASNPLVKETVEEHVADQMTEQPSSVLDKPARLFLLDGMALLYRAHFALVRAPRFASSGLCTSGVFGLTNTILDILNRQSPTHIAVCFDTEHETERHRIFPEYKAQRDQMPEDLRSQRPWVDRLLDALHIPAIRCPGYEADDVIGTMAHQAARDGIETFMVTPDKDYDQLVTDKIKIYKPGRKGGEIEILGVPEVLAKWEINHVEQVIDILGLMGDSSDNIPGVSGIGPKTAQKLISDFGSIENLIANTDQLKGKQRERIEQSIEAARLSKKLVTIDLDVPHGIDLAALARQDWDEEKLSQLFEELEFDSLGKKLFGSKFSSANNRTKVIREKRESEIQNSLFNEPVKEKTIVDCVHDYKIVSTPAQRQELLAKLKQHKQICFDTETTGLDPRTVTPIGMSFCFQSGQAFYVDCGHHLDGETADESARAIIAEFRCVFEDESIEILGHNLKYDFSVLKWRAGIEVRGKVFDTMLAHSMKEPEMRHGLDYLAQLYLGYKPISTETLLGPKGKDQKNMRDVPLADVAQYACEDADVTWQVAARLRPDIESQGVAQVCYEVECPLVPVLIDMEYEGVRLDVDALEKYSKVLEIEIEDLQAQIFSHAGHAFNIDSPKQLGIVLYEELQVEGKPKKTSTGQYSTREAELERLASRHEIIQLILEYRNARKLKTVYVDTLPLAVNPRTGHVHTNYSQTWTATGRMQSSDPNLQTIPIRKERGRDIRAAFVARNDDYEILSADYSQIELRLMAQLSGDQAMRDAFIQGEDIHTVTASKVYKVDVDEVTREMRSKAKMVNFGIIYGISSFGLQQRLNIPRAEAKELIDNYFDKYPGVQTYIDKTIAFAKEHGYVATLTGRRRYIRDINSRSRVASSTAERLAMNSPIQGTAADILKLAMINVYRELKRGDFKTKMILTVHDEIVFDMYRPETSEVMPLIERAMMNTLPLEVPIVIEMGTGKNWLEAH